MATNRYDLVGDLHVFATVEWGCWMLGGRASSAMCDSKMRSMEACCFSFRDI